MHDALMSDTTEAQIDWIQQRIMDQVDAGMEQYSELESGEHKLLQFTHQVVDAVLGKIDVQHALTYVHHLQHHGALDSSPDQLTALHNYFYANIALELARRYA